MPPKPSRVSSHESLSALRARVGELEEEVVRRRSEAAAMAAAARLAGEFLPVEELAERVVETIMELFDAGSACIRRLDPDGGLVALAWAGTPGTPAFQRGHVLPRGMATGAQAVAYIVMLRFVIVVPITIVGLVLLAARYGGLGRLRGARLEAGA